MLFAKLGWLTIDDIVRSRKLFVFDKICNSHGQEYFPPMLTMSRGSYGQYENLT